MPRVIPLLHAMFFLLQIIFKLVTRKRKSNMKLRHNSKSIWKHVFSLHREILLGKTTSFSSHVILNLIYVIKIQAVKPPN
jgi:hypothetical protein